MSCPGVHGNSVYYLTCNSVRCHPSDLSSAGRAPVSRPNDVSRRSSNDVAFEDRWHLPSAGASPGHATPQLYVVYIAGHLLQYRDGPPNRLGMLAISSTPQNGYGSLLGFQELSRRVLANRELLTGQSGCPLQQNRRTTPYRTPVSQVLAGRSRTGGTACRKPVVIIPSRKDPVIIHCTN